MLYEICLQLKQFGCFTVEGLSFHIIRGLFLIETDNWYIYISQFGCQYNRRKGLYTLEKVESCPDEAEICHSLLGILIERLKENENPL